MNMIKAEHEALRRLNEGETIASVGKEGDHLLLIGLGICLGKGFASYLGNMTFEITAAGKARILMDEMSQEAQDLGLY